MIRDIGGHSTRKQNTVITEAKDPSSPRSALKESLMRQTAEKKEEKAKLLSVQKNKKSDQAVGGFAKSEKKDEYLNIKGNSNQSLQTHKKSIKSDHYKTN